MPERIKGVCVKCGASFETDEQDDPFCGLCDHYYTVRGQFVKDVAAGDPDALALRDRLKARGQL